MGWMSFLVSGVFVVLGIPLALRMVPPNRWYGVRTAETLSNSDVWYSVNALGGKAIVVAGILSLLILLALNHFWTADPAMKKMVGIVVPLGMLSLAIVVMVFARQSS